MLKKEGLKELVVLNLLAISVLFVAIFSVNYFDGAITGKAGYTHDQIEQALVKNGWDKNRIEKVFKKIAK